MKRSENFENFASNWAELQGELTGVTKDGFNKYHDSHYATLNAVLEAIKGPMAAHGFTFIQGESSEGGEYLTTLILHWPSGEWMESNYKLPEGTTPQQKAAATTYARRISLITLLSLPALDDDGNAAEKITEKHVDKKPSNILTIKNLTGNINAQTNAPTHCGVGMRLSIYPDKATGKTPFVCSICNHRQL